MHDCGCTLPQTKLDPIQNYFVFCCAHIKEEWISGSLECTGFRKYVHPHGTWKWILMHRDHTTKLKNSLARVPEFFYNAKSHIFITIVNENFISALELYNLKKQRVF
jgi:hypothetical protein